MEFSRVDPRNDDQFMAWFNVLNRCEILRDQGRGEGWQPSEWRARALDDLAPTYHQLFEYGGDPLHPVAVGALEVSREDNLHWIRGDLFVDPPERRRGFGSTLLQYLEATARQLDRSSLLFWVVEDATERGRGANRFFAPAHGYDIVEESVQRDLTWPRPAGELEGLWAQWRPLASAYEILSWRGPTPESLLKGRAHLSAIMPLEVPPTDFGLEEERWDERRVRHHERRVDEMGRDFLVAVAQYRKSAELVGFSELTVSRARPETAYQWNTMVTRAHRGHRLGGLLKIATMRLLAEGNYVTRTITTSNASRNAPMIAVNEALGAKVSGGVVNWRKVLK
ncbi:MAG TPA: GNAT family N-acetyltransferase [Acidimicrobiales bacterium]|nr:GNAT family N-acetyltransferase [Acidimicrobiales bacterium]